MHSFVTSKNAQWRRLIWPTLYISEVQQSLMVEMIHIPLRNTINIAQN